jgi:UDP-N-acetylglucosamine--N-acetylmuramyl-(pentapeptide) pyrophosphoryl-undecaprenol N-acetylglucosamine transferase
MNKTPVIVLTGGGSGGHITPLLSLARALKSKNSHCNIVYIGHKGDKFDSLQEGFHDFDFVAFVNGGKFRRYHGESWIRQLMDVHTMLLNVRDFFRVIGSISKAWRILAKVKPDVVFSKGGFVGVPVGVAARVRGIPIVTHDSDTVPGMANRIIGRWAVVQATGMPANFYEYKNKRTVYTGIPVDSRLRPLDTEQQKRIKKSIGVNPANQVLLVSGGSLGARDLNDKVLKMAPELLRAYPHLHLIHITGQQHEQEIKRQYGVLLKDAPNQKITVLGFTNELYKYIGAADLIISRAGASSVAEYAAARKPCILIPSPFLTGGHQVKNAQQLQKIGAVEVVKNDALAETLLGEVVKLLSDPTKRKSLAAKLGSTAKLKAADDLADVLLNVINKK